MGEDSGSNIHRRQFLSLVTNAIMALIAAAYTIPAFAYILGPSLRQEAEQWITLGSVDKVPLGTPTLFKTRIQKQTGWITSEEDLSVYILTQNGRDFVAMSNICTHLGCRIRWISDRKQFFCPCHNGVFDQHGNVVSGPPPRPLDHYPIKVEQNHISILVG
ncbi:MAG: Rieske 2Fe-2S domain-containing protein [Anaerolineales bacterium]|nr:Rieske 2Fe-2S domain-containing protein [Anaerolineales bacterium]